MVLGVLSVSSTPSFAVQFCNTTPIIGPGGTGPANVYPSSIVVSGLTGTVTDVNVTLLDVSTTGDNNSPPQHWVEDADVLVSAPNNSNVILMSDAGGNNDLTSGPVVDADLTFDDQAPNQLPADTGPLVSGTYRPVDDDDDVGPQPGFEQDVWASPAPTPSNSTSLSTFNGIDPNGTWNLWLVDDQTQGAVRINGGWCVDILTTGGGGTTTTLPPTTTTLPPTTTTSTTAPPGLLCDGRTPTIVGTSGGERIVGTAGPDVIMGLGGDDQILGLGGDDVICAGAGNDQLIGGEGNDRLFGEAGSDYVVGENGNDALNGGTEADQCHGGAGTDSAVACEGITGTP